MSVFERYRCEHRYVIGKKNKIQKLMYQYFCKIYIVSFTLFLEETILFPDQRAEFPGSYE